MDSIRQYFKRTDKMYLLLCIFSSVMAVLALSSWAAKQGNGFATDEVTGVPSSALATTAGRWCRRALPPLAS